MPISQTTDTPPASNLLRKFKAMPLLLFLSQVTLPICKYHLYFQF